MIYQKMRDYRRACRELQQAVKLDGSNAQVRATHRLSAPISVTCVWGRGQGTVPDGVMCARPREPAHYRYCTSWLTTPPRFMFRKMVYRLPLP